MSQNSKKESFPYYFCLRIEGSGFRSVKIMSGSGSEWSKNIRIRSTTLFITGQLCKVPNAANTVRRYLSTR
jgi:hypothetical protein